MGIVSDRCEINRQIKADNALLRELKAKVKKLAAAVKTSIPELANALESLRENMIVLMYRISAYCEAKRPSLRSKTAAFRF